LSNVRERFQHNVISLAYNNLWRWCTQAKTYLLPS